MKVLIWVVCILVYAVIQTVISESGIVLGGIPTALLFGGMMWVAGTLSNKVGKKETNSGKTSRYSKNLL